MHTYKPTTGMYNSRPQGCVCVCGEGGNHRVANPWGQRVFPENGSPSYL